MNLRLTSLVCDLYYLLFFAFTFPVWFPLVLFRPSWRSGFLQRLGFVSLPPPGRRRLWVHGVSVGEVLAARSLITALAADPRFEVVLSTTTRTGQAVAKKTFPALPVFHFPLDLSFIAGRVLDRVAPALVILVELELWPNFLLHARMRKIPFVFVNGRITRRSAESYRYLSWILRPLLRDTGLHCVQNEEYASRLVALGAEGTRVRITGNLKYDNLPAGPDPEAAAAMAASLGVAEGETVLVGGSIHPGEDDALVEAYTILRRTRPGLRLVLAPRHPERFDRAEEAARRAGLPVRRRTAGPGDPGGSPVILLDTVGELGRVYAAADVVFVGGSLVPHGGQNMMEPAAYGKPVLFGPHVHNFREDAALLLARDGAVQVPDAPALAGAVEALLADPARAAALGAAGAAAVAERRGATARTLESLERVHLGRLVAGSWVAEGGEKKS